MCQTSWKIRPGSVPYSATVVCISTFALTYYSQTFREPTAAPQTPVIPRIPGPRGKLSRDVGVGLMEFYVVITGRPPHSPKQTVTQNVCSETWGCRFLCMLAWLIRTFSSKILYMLQVGAGNRNISTKFIQAQALTQYKYYCLEQQSGKPKITNSSFQVQWRAK